MASGSWLRKLCQRCSETDTRIFNDAAYYPLSYSSESLTLSDVAIDFPDLSWAEAFTAAKLIGNGTGWHVGAMIGSPDFIGDLREVKGKTDTGFVAPMAAGVLAAIENDQQGIHSCREMYRSRLLLIIKLLTGNGMKLATEPGAGFFTPWLVPSKAFGVSVEGAEHFNSMMIDETGVVVVPFPGYVRYAVVGDIEVMSGDIDKAFKTARVSYS